MKPVFLTLVFLLGGLSASSVYAADRYTEVWNPPEAQTAKANKPKTHTAAKKKRKSTTSVKQVADKAAADSQPSATPRPKAIAPKPSEPVIPRKYGPNGEVMRV